MASDVTACTGSGRVDVGASARWTGVGRAWTGVAGGEAMADVGSLKRTKLLKSAWVVFRGVLSEIERISITQIASVRPLMCHLRIYFLCVVNSQA